MWYNIGACPIRLAAGRRCKAVDAILRDLIVSVIGGLIANYIGVLLPRLVEKLRSRKGK